MGANYSRTIIESANRPEDPPNNRSVFISFEQYETQPHKTCCGRSRRCCFFVDYFAKNVSYKFRVHYQRYSWTCEMTYDDVIALLNALRFDSTLRSIQEPSEVKELRTLHHSMKKKDHTTFCMLSCCQTKDHAFIQHVV